MINQSNHFKSGYFLLLNIQDFLKDIFGHLKSWTKKIIYKVNPNKSLDIF